MNHQSVYATAVPVEATKIPIQAYGMEANAPIAPDQSAMSSQLNEAGAREFLQARKWPGGLVDTFVENIRDKVVYRCFICDDSGSMMSNDGHRFVEKANGKRTDISCSRWAELTESLRFHAGLAKSSNAETEFRMLNGAAPITIGGGADDRNYHNLLSVLDGGPHGGTPLCRHIREVTEKIRQMEATLRANRKVACLVIASDGISSDGDIASAMTPLKDLPVWVVIRLCTDDEKVADYWNKVDTQLELNMDVLDDFVAEGAEVKNSNSWLTYGEPMHRLREFGIPIKEIDCLDSMKLSLEQSRKICHIIFGGNSRDIPHPEAEWNDFAEWVQTKNKEAGMVWCPNQSKLRNWVDIKKLGAAHGKAGCSIS